MGHKRYRNQELPGQPDLGRTLRQTARICLRHLAAQRQRQLSRLRRAGRHR